MASIFIDLPTWVFLTGAGKGILHLLYHVPICGGKLTVAGPSVAQYLFVSGVCLLGQACQLGGIIPVTCLSIGFDKGNVFRSKGRCKTFLLCLLVQGDG